ncbi:MAG TPA: ATP-binding protein [Phycisphaerae bacterium]|nr:ATP-binding protein [Phycisphaerae bacterium]
MPSIRRRLLLGTALGTAVVLSAAALTLYVMMRASLFAEFDGALRQRVQTLASLVEQEGDQIDLEFTETDMAQFERPDRPEYFQVWLADGATVERSPSLGGENLPRLDGPLNETVIRPGVLPDGRSGRLAGLTFRARLDDEDPGASVPGQVTLVLARDVENVNAALGSLRVVLLLVGGAATLLSVVVLAWTVRFGLKPVSRMADEIEGIDEKCLSARIDPARAPLELEPVTRRLNDLLVRLEAAFAREKTLTADVAHELRTPLAGIRSTLEVSLSRERSAGAHREAIGDCLSICKQTQTMVENLLALTRLDAGGREPDCRPVQVDILIRDAWAPFDGPAADRRLRVQWEVQRDLTFNTDADRLQLVLSNIFENAVNHVNEGGEIGVNCAADDGRLRLIVSNTGSLISAEQIHHVFDRFWRADAARKDVGAHCGLGLSLCKEIVERLGGRITAESTDDGRFRITVVLLSKTSQLPESPTAGRDDQGQG